MLFAGVLGRVLGVDEILRRVAGVMVKVEDDGDGDSVGRVDRVSVSRWAADGVQGFIEPCCSITRQVEISESFLKHHRLHDRAQVHEVAVTR